MNKKLFELAEDIKKYAPKAIAINEILKAKVNTYNFRNNDMIFSLNDDEFKKFSDKELENIEKVKEYYICNALLDVISSELEINSIYQYVKINDLSTERVFQLYKEWVEIAKAPYPLYLDNYSIYKVFSKDKDLSLSDSIKTLYFNQNQYSVIASWSLGYITDYDRYKESFYNEDINKLSIAVNNMLQNNACSIEKIVKTDEFKDICKRIDDLNATFKENNKPFRIDIDSIEFKELEVSGVYPNNKKEIVYSAYIDENDELDDVMGIRTEEIHNDCFQVNYYGLLSSEDKFEINVSVTLFDKDLLYEDYPDIADKVCTLSKSDNEYVPLNDNEIKSIKDKFKDFIEYEREKEEEREL